MKRIIAWEIVFIVALWVFMILSAALHGADFGDIPANLTINAGETVRRNAGDTAFESFTPSAGFSGLFTDLDFTSSNLTSILTRNFSDLQSKPTTLSGYGITDAVPNTRTVNGHALSSNVTVTPTDLSLVIGTNVQAWDTDLDTWATKTPYAGTVVVTTGKTFTDTNTLTLSGTDGSTLNIGAGGTLGSNAFTSTTIPTIASTTNILVGNGSGNAVGSRIADNGTNYTDTVSQNSSAGILVQNTNSGNGSIAAVSVKNDANTATIGIRATGTNYDFGSATPLEDTDQAQVFTDAASGLLLASANSLSIRSGLGVGLDQYIELVSPRTYFRDSGHADIAIVDTTGIILSQGTFIGALTGNASTATSAATLTTARNLWGQSFNGSAAVGGAIELGTVGTTDTTFTRSSAGHASIEGSVIGLASDNLGFFTASTSAAIGVGSIELGNASDCTLDRGPTARLRAEGINVALSSDTLSFFTTSTSAPIGVGTIELGHATDTTLSRLGAGSLGVEGTAVLLNGGALGTPSSGTLTNCTFPTLNQDTTGSALLWKTSGTGLASIAGPGNGTVRAYTFPNNDATMLYSGGALGTPSGGTLTNCTFPTLNQNTTGSAATLTTARNLWGQSFNGSAAVSGSLTGVGDITGGASSMTITAGTGNSRTLALQSTTSGGVATTFLTGNADQTVTFAAGITAAGASTIGNNAFTAGTVELANGTANTLSGSGGVLSIEGVKVLATNSTSGTQQGLVAVNSTSGAVVGTQNRATGSSSSGTPGTNIATLTAAGGNQLVCISGFTTQSATANTQLTVTITYSDSTTTSLATSSATAQNVFINDAAIFTPTNQTVTAHSTKKITSVAVTTLGTGTAVRVAALSAVEIPQ